MAKVKITGNASGTGVLTVTAPNTDTDRTITLPDADVTLGADDTKLPLAGGTLTGDLNIGSVGSVTSSGADLKITGTDDIFFNVAGASNNILQLYGGSSANDQSKFDSHVHPLTDNSKDLGNASERWKDLYLSGGLKVGGTAAANTLDDYEEGTWTPGFEGATISGNNGVGFYTKIGNVVYVTYYTGTISISNQSGAARITGLPFTVLSDSSQYSTFYYSHGTAVADSVGGHFTTGQTKMQFVVYNATANAPWVNGTKYAMVSGIYLTTA
jgi:hypothetical protein